ncbi:MAG: sialate O-acetylesterase [Chitinophagaceae bacterium]|nr:sialate O-acetylesterase [Chitinophagaceae bacterium]MCW5928316.1 sialate O-acetylesterase [Chitinophagaceae bacterium]
MSVDKWIPVILILLFALPAAAQIRLPRIVRDSMVLQRDTKINIWGWASEGEKITVTFNRKTYRARAGSDGKWKLQLAATPAGGPYSMEVKGTNRIMLHNILVGDVWLCSGQSNMEHSMRLHNIIYAREIEAAGYAEIRQFKVPNTTSLTGPQEELPGGYWKSADADNVNDFSVVAYFFARSLYEKYKVPVGLINATWGGSPIEAWMNEESLQPFPEIFNRLKKNRDTAYVNETNRRAVRDMGATEVTADRGMTEKWYETLYQPKGWRPIAVPGYWEDQGVRNLDGVVWYRREIDIPASSVNSPAKLFLGRIVDADVVYINGERVGGFGYMYPQRRYPLREGLLQAGRNLVVVRVTNNNGKGGFVPDKPYYLVAGNDTIDLTGYWSYKVGQVYSGQRGPSGAITIQYQPTALYNAMLAPLRNYNLRGFLWYQGESNTGNPDEYAKLQPAMIAEWQKQWKSESLPFLYVQLPGFMDYNYLPSESAWAAFREAQSKTLAVPRTGMAVAIDLGEWNDIHPDRKMEVGERLALAAQKISYGENIIFSGPTCQSTTIEGDKIILSFSNTGGGLTTSDGEPLQEFAIAGEDKKFVWANAVIRGDKIIVSSEKVHQPKYVRYAWADNPVNPNLINREGLPASPFRTDQ